MTRPTPAMPPLKDDARIPDSPKAVGKMNAHILNHARVVTPESDFTGALVIEDGLIADIQQDRSIPGGKDLGGLWLGPGCIDVHSDYLEKEIRPRPKARFPLPLAFHHMDQRAAACGITTVFSAISFSESEYSGRTFENAVERAEAIDALRDHSLVRHYVHARLDPNTDTVVEYLDRAKVIPSLKMVVYNESIPGQRQVKLADIIPRRARILGISPDAYRKKIMTQIRALSKINKRPEIQQTLGDTNHLIGSHDDTTEAHVEEAWRYGATLSEMPTTIVAARKAKALGMWVCMGAPNYVRGGSHCGNLSCLDAMKEDLVDILCSDYHFPTMMMAVIKMMQDGTPSSEAFRYVSLSPAACLGMDHYTGSIEIGKSADLVCFDITRGIARVRSVWVQGVERFISNPSSSTPRMVANTSK